MNKKRGVSLIVLIITIVLLLLLSGAIINMFNNKNLTEAARLSTIESDIQYMIDEYEVKYNELLLKYNGDESKIFVNHSKELQTIIPEKYKDKYVVTINGIRYVGNDEKEKQIAKKMGIEI